MITVSNAHGRNLSSSSSVRNGKTIGVGIDLKGNAMINKMSLSEVKDYLSKKNIEFDQDKSEEDLKALAKTTL